jgi:hypothetical protein
MNKFRQRWVVDAMAELLCCDDGTPFVVGHETTLERIENFVNALHAAAEKFELGKAREFIKRCAREREEKFAARTDEEILQS